MWLLVLPRRFVLLWFSFSKGFARAPFVEPELRRGPGPCRKTTWGACPHRALRRWLWV